MHAITVREIQNQHKEWAERNFPMAEKHQPLLGMLEELGELSHAHLKKEQGIRGDAEKHIADQKDALGDILIFMLHYCNLHEFDLQTILDETWTKVKERDWTKNSHNGEV